MSNAGKPRWSCRRAAAEVIASILDDSGSLASLLPAAQARIGEKDHALLAELCYGTLRHYFSLRHQIDNLLQKPLKEKDTDVLALLLIGSYQLHYTRIPSYAAVNSCVDVTREIHKDWAKGLVNAVLRSIQRAQEKSGESIRPDEARLDHPSWLIDRICAAWPQHADELFRVNNSKAPMTLRTNARKISRDDYLDLLKATGILAHTGNLSSHAIILDNAVDVQQLPKFAEGFVSVQDEAAQLSAFYMLLAPHLSVLDACAAPGGKTCHLLECEPALQVTALDTSESRVALIDDNLRRLELQAKVLVADATHPETWWQQKCGGKLFDRILVDAPCSATGVIRHHPDIKLLRKASDIPALAATQLALLRALWPLLKPEGYLLYVTCSILPAENDEVIAAFVASTADTCCVETIDDTGGIKTPFGKQLLPELNGHDGFYYCLLRKQV